MRGDGIAAGQFARPREWAKARLGRSRWRGVRFLAPALVIAACLGAVEARATVVAGTFSGFIDHGTDYAGVFGAANATLDGLAFVTTFTYDASKGLRSPPAATADQVSAFSPQEPVLTYALTINGVTDTLGLKTDSFAAVLPGTDFRIGGELLTPTGRIQVGNIAYGSAFDDLDHPVSFLDMKVPPVPFNGFAQRFGFGAGVPVYFMIFDTKRVDFVGADGSGGGGASGGVPEPATWSLLLTGFLGLGAAIRRRRHQRVARTLERQATAI